MKTIAQGIAVLLMMLLAGSVLAQDPWPPKALLPPQDLAAGLNGGQAVAPKVIFVGFPVLYRAAHIRGAMLAGPASKPEGLEALRKSVGEFPRGTPIVLYCGCCPFAKCPNVRPAYRALRDLGFRDVRVVEMDTNFHTDWVARGYPVEK